MGSRRHFAALLILLCAPATLRAQAIAHPNQIRGTYRFTNVDPRIVAHLDRLTGTLTIEAHSTTPPSLMAVATAQGPWRSLPYELTVEASETGRAYALQASVLTLGDMQELFTFPTATSEPALLEPAPDVDLDVQTCAAMAVLRVPPGAMVWASLFGVAAQVRGVSPTDHLEILLPSTGREMTLTAWITVGSDPSLDTFTYRRSFRVTPICDEILEIDCQGVGQGDGEGDCPLSEVRGSLDIIGEDEVVTELRGQGPWGNHRTALVEPSPPGISFRLRNLVPSEVEIPPLSWGIQARLRMGAGGQLRTMSLGHDVHVPCADVVDLGSEFQILPGWLAGDIRLESPPWPGRARGAMATLTRPSDTLVSGSSHSYVSGHTEHLSATTEFTGMSSPEGLRFDGDYALPLGGRSSATVGWHPEKLWLTFDDDGTPGAPETAVDASVSVAQAWDGGHLPSLEAGQVIDRPQHHCFGLVALGILSTGGPFTDPRVEIDGALEGLDFEGRMKSLAYSGGARGSVVSSAPPQGIVMMPLPEGIHVFEPTIQEGASRFEIMPVTINLKCRQVLTLMPELHVDLDAVPPCRETGLVGISGRVVALDDVASVVVEVEGGDRIEVCAPCGDDPAFDVAVAAPGEARVTVTATDVSGRVATAEGMSVEAREPSALDLRPGTVPLRVARIGPRLEVSWEPGVVANVYRGSIASLAAGIYDHRGIDACDATGSVEIDAAGSSYFLAGAPCEWGDGSLGRDSRGFERPPAIERCLR